MNCFPQFSILKTQRMCLQGKGGGTGPWHWNMQGIGICGAAPSFRLHALDIRFRGSRTAYSKVAHIPVRRAGAIPLSLKVHPLCLQYAELPTPLHLSLERFLYVSILPSGLHTDTLGRREGGELQWLPVPTHPNVV